MNRFTINAIRSAVGSLAPSSPQSDNPRLEAAMSRPEVYSLRASNYGVLQDSPDHSLSGRDSGITALVRAVAKSIPVAEKMIMDEYNQISTFAERVEFGNSLMREVQAVAQSSNKALWRSIHSYGVARICEDANELSWLYAEDDASHTKISSLYVNGLLEAIKQLTKTNQGFLDDANYERYNAQRLEHATRIITGMSEYRANLDTSKLSRLADDFNHLNVQNDGATSRPLVVDRAKEASSGISFETRKPGATEEPTNKTDAKNGVFPHWEPIKKAIVDTLEEQGRMSLSSEKHVMAMDTGTWIEPTAEGFKVSSKHNPADMVDMMQMFKVGARASGMAVCTIDKVASAEEAARAVKLALGAPAITPKLSESALNMLKSSKNTECVGALELYEKAQTNDVKKGPKM